MPAETFFCPHCQCQLTKSAQAYVMGEAMASKKSTFINMGSMQASVTCPGCGGTIDNKKMMMGEYDNRFGKASSGGSGLGYIVVAALIGIVIYFVLVR